jgi:hypothetical protein
MDHYRRPAALSVLNCGGIVGSVHTADVRRKTLASPRLLWAVRCRGSATRCHRRHRPRAARSARSRFAAMYAKPDVLRGFLSAVSGISPRGAGDRREVSLGRSREFRGYRRRAGHGAGHAGARILISAGSVSIFLKFSRYSRSLWPRRGCRIGYGSRKATF